MLAITEANVSKLDGMRRRSGGDRTDARRGTKILVVDDHFLIREALRSVLKELKGEAKILEAVAASQAMQIVAEHTDISFVLLELDLPDRDGLSVLGDLRARHPDISVVVVSARQDRDSVTKALGLGALGFIPKSEGRKVLLSALELVFAGGTYIPPEFLLRDAPCTSSTKPACRTRNGNAMRPAGTKPSDLGLGGRQLDVLQLMMQGKTNKGICRALNLAEPTVKNHVTAILKALKVTNRTEAVIAVGELGWEWPFVRANGHANGHANGTPQTLED
jgi:DNA-binding NarL/FixJ family response regulator